MTEMRREMRREIGEKLERRLLESITIHEATSEDQSKP